MLTAAATGSDSAGCTFTSLQRVPHARDRRHAAFRRATASMRSEQHHEADPIVIGRDDFGEARRDVRIQSEAIEPAGAHATQATGIDGYEHVEMLVFS